MAKTKTVYKIYDTLNGDKILIHENVTAREVSELINIQSNTVSTKASRHTLISNRYYIEREEKQSDETIKAIIDIYNKIKSNKGAKYKIEFVLVKEY